MADINFYHIKQSSIENVLLMLLQKTLSSDKKAIIRCYNHSLMEHYDQTIWTLQKEAFVPHGTISDVLPEKQPVLLTTEIDNSNDAEFLFITSFCPIENLDSYDRIFIIFEDNDQEATEWARTSWKTLKTHNHTLTYWIQNENGKWHKKD